jgi:protein-disulfide isomerase
MSRFFACFNMNRLNRTGLCFGIVSAALLLGPAATAHAQFGAPPTTQVHDASVLRPPAGARVAIVMFSDLECPDCAHANPLLREASAKYHIPLVHYDFPLPFHNWSFQAAVNARWFDSHSKKIGDEYRDYIFANQISIQAPDSLQKYTATFARSRGISLPFAVDPQGRFATQVKADYALGQRIGIEHTPTIWVVTSGAKSGAPFVEVVDRSKLFQLIDQALANTRSAAPAKPVRR